MKVKDLIEHLAKLDPELDVLLYSEDEAILSHGNQSRVLDIESIEVATAEKIRDPMGEPMLRFCRTDYAQDIALIHVIAQF